MFFGMLRVKNEERWIARALKPLVEVCDTVYVFNDHSTDRTVEIILNTPRCLLINSPFNDLDESRDKTFLLLNITNQIEQKTLKPDGPHWVVCVDGDEEICWGDLGRMVGSEGLRGVSYSFQILTLYDSPNQIRVDPPYNKFFRPSMFRLIKPGMKFLSNGGHGGGFHCSNVPADIGYGVTTHSPEPVRVKHYGYMEKETRERKYKWYVEHDPGYESWYRGECLSGNVKLAKLPEGS